MSGVPNALVLKSAVPPVGPDRLAARDGIASPGPEPGS
jgi:hypothetical protein